MKPTDMFDQDKNLGEMLKDDAITRVGTSHSKWVDVALNAVRTIAERRAEFTTDAVWYLLRESPEPMEPRAMGAAMRLAARQKICYPTDRTSKSVRPECHRRPLQVWRSLITKWDLTSTLRDGEAF